MRSSHSGAVSSAENSRITGIPDGHRLHFKVAHPHRFASGGDVFQVISRSKNDAAVYSSTVWPALTPPEAPNIRPALAPLNCYAPILHGSPLSCITKTGDMLTRVINLRNFVAPKSKENAALRRQ